MLKYKEVMGLRKNSLYMDASIRGRFLSEKFPNFTSETKSETVSKITKNYFARETT
jgi:hypothetical protein